MKATPSWSSKFMNLLDLIIAVTAVITAVILVVHVLSGKKPEEFLYSNEYANYFQYFFRPKSLLLSLLYGVITAITAFSAIQSSSFNGYEYPLSAALLIFITFMLLVYNCWPGTAGKKIAVLLSSVLVATIFWLFSFTAGDVDLRENLSATIFLSLFTGFILATWIRSE